MAQNTANFHDLLEVDKNVCRACMSNKNYMSCVFNNKKLKTAEMLEFCTGIRISESDNLPKKMCKICLKKLEIAYKFKKVCLETEKTLTAWMKLRLDDEEIKKECLEIEFQETDIEFRDDVNDMKVEIMKEEILITKEEDDFNYDDDDVTICISDDDDDFNNLDYKPTQQIKNIAKKPYANELKNTKQLIAKIPAGVSVKVLSNKNTNKGHIEKTAEKKIKNTVNKVKSKKYVKKMSKQKLQTSDGTEKKLEEEISNVTENRLFCKKCSEQFTTAQEIKDHRLKAHPFVPTICAICGFLARNQYAQYRHMKGHEEPTHRCNVCGYSTCFPRDLDKHLRIHRDKKEFACEFCPRAFHSNSNLHAHIRLNHGSVNKKYACPRCDYKTYGKHKLVRHLDAHDNIKRYECEICNSRYSRRELWKKHVETKHDIIIPKMRPGKQRNGVKYNIEGNLKYLHKGEVTLHSEGSSKSLQGKNNNREGLLKNDGVSGNSGDSVACVENASRVSEKDDMAI